ncbi:hypothetical protein [Tenacibaculum sp.]
MNPSRAALSVVSTSIISPCLVAVDAISSITFLGVPSAAFCLGVN